MRVTKILNLMLLMALSMMATACMLGPNFRSPPKPPVQAFTHTPLPAKTATTPSAGKAGKSQTFLKNQDIPKQWWRLYHSKALNCLIEQGIARNPGLEAAYASLKAAQEALNVQVGNLLFPAINAGLTAQRQKFSAASIGQPNSSIFNLFNASVNVSYTLDIFGASRRQIEALQAQVDYQQFQLIAAYLALTANIVTTAVSVASYQAQIKATLDLIHIEEGQLHILQKQYKLGGISLVPVLTQETLVNTTQATLPPLQNSLSRSKHALLALVGDFPDRPLPRLLLESLTLPGDLPLSLPSNLVRQRPDVRAAEALMHQACANVGVATANLFPQFNITNATNYGYEAAVLSQLFNPASNVWAIAGNIAQPIFHGGALFSARRQAIATYNQTAAQYRQTVLNAFANVADSLRAIETDARTLREAHAAKNSAWQNLNLVQHQYFLGGASYLALLIAQQQYQNTVIPVIRAEAARYSDTAALFQSLGGGWWKGEQACPERSGQKQAGTSFFARDSLSRKLNAKSMKEGVNA